MIYCTRALVLEPVDVYTTSQKSVILSLRERFARRDAERVKNGKTVVPSEDWVKNLESFPSTVALLKAMLFFQAVTMQNSHSVARANLTTACSFATSSDSAINTFRTYSRRLWSLADDFSATAHSMLFELAIAWSSVFLWRLIPLTVNATNIWVCCIS